MATSQRAPFRRVCHRLFAALLLATAPLLALAEGPPQQIIVKLSEKGMRGQRAGAVESRIAQLAAENGVQLRRLRRIATGADLFRVHGERLRGAMLERLLERLEDSALVEYAEEDRILQPLATPNDSRYSEQWHYYEATGGLNAPPAWDVTHGAGVTVAVIDTGYRPHADLAANIVGGYDFIVDTFVANDGNGRDSNAEDPGDWYSNGECGFGTGSSDSSWHGTHVAGTIAAVTNNGSGVSGVAYGAKVVPVRALGKCGGYTSDIADGMIWAAGGSVSGVPGNANPAKVLNLSLGGSGSCDSTTQAAINSARSNGAVVVVAAGNSNTDVTNASPANCSGVITVAATDRNGARAYYSNYGNLVDVAAPGGDVRSSSANGILSTLNSGTTTPGADSYAFYQGTSMATPHVAGVAALMFAVEPALTPDGLESALKGSTRAFPAACSGCGTGIVDAAAAVAAAGGGAPPPPPPSGTLANGVPVTNLSASSGQWLHFTMSVPAGASNLSFTISGGSGDADLYVRFGSTPTDSSYDCRPYLNGNSESCSFAAPAAGTWYVSLNAYASFSGVTLVGSYTEPSGGGSCPSGFTAYSGTLSSGGSVYLPGSGGYTAGSGIHSGDLTGAAGTDFDLYLQRKGGWRWSNVASSLSYTSTESIDYSGSSGTYRWRIYAYSGSGSYHFCAKTP